MNNNSTERRTVNVAVDLHQEVSAICSVYRIGIGDFMDRAVLRAVRDAKVDYMDFISQPMTEAEAPVEAEAAE